MRCHIILNKILDGVSNDVALAINIQDITSLLICAAGNCPVMFIRASDTFIWNSRERLGIPSTFQPGKQYYNPESPGELYTVQYTVKLA